MKTVVTITIIGIVVAASIIFGVIVMSFNESSPKTDSFLSLNEEEHYQIEITGMKDVYYVDESYSFSYVLSGFGDSCGSIDVTYPTDENENITMSSKDLCSETTPRDFVWDVQKERGTTFGHVKLNSGEYFVKVEFKKHDIEISETKSFTVKLPNAKKMDASAKPNYVKTFPLSFDDDSSTQSARDIILDQEGYLYVSHQNHSVEKYDSDGNSLLVFGHPEVPFDKEVFSNPGYLNHPEGIAISSDGILYVVDSVNNRIQYFNANGTSLGSWNVSEFSEKPSRYWSPYWLIFDNEEEFLYVTNSHNSIQILDKKGNLIEILGKGGFHPGHFNGMEKIAFDSKGYLHVADQNNNRVQIFDENLEFVAEKKGFVDPRDVAFDSKGNIYVLENFGGSYHGIIKKFDSKWNKLFTLTTRDFTDSYVAFEDYDVGFEEIVALDIGPDDVLYVLDAEQGVHVFEP